MQKKTSGENFQNLIWIFSSCMLTGAFFCWTFIAFRELSPTKSINDSLAHLSIPTGLFLFSLVITIKASFFTEKKN